MQGKNLNRKYFLLSLLVFLVGLFMSSCDCCRSTYRPPRYGIQGIKDVVVTPDEEGLNLVVLRVKEGYYVTEKAKIISYHVDSAQLQSENSYPIYPATLTGGYNSFVLVNIYPVEGTNNTFLFRATFFASQHAPAKIFYFINENGKFYRVRGEYFNSGFRVDNGYYFSITSLLYWYPFTRYDTLEEAEKRGAVKISPDRLPGSFEKPPYNSSFQPEIIFKDKGLDLSRLFIVEGGGIIGDGNFIYFQGCDSFMYFDLLDYPWEIEYINSYLFIGKVSFNDYSMNLTDVRYIAFDDPTTFTTILGAEYFEDMGFVAYTREFPRKIGMNFSDGLDEIKDKVMILAPDDLTILREKEISYSNTVTPECSTCFSSYIYPDNRPSHFVAFDRVDKRIISGIGNRISIINLVSFKIDTVILPSPWVFSDEDWGEFDGGGNTGIWVDGKGNIWVIARDISSGKINEKEVKPGALVSIRFRYGILRIYREKTGYSVKLVSVLE